MTGGKGSGKEAQETLSTSLGPVSGSSSSCGSVAALAFAVLKLLPNPTSSCSQWFGCRCVGRHRGLRVVMPLQRIYNLFEMKRYINLVKHKKRTKKTYLVGPKRLRHCLGPVLCVMQLVCLLAGMGPVAVSC